MKHKLKFLTRQDLGVPDWFICDGCSHSPDNKWLTPACVRHDWDYWLGSTADKVDEWREKADKGLRAVIKHNAKASAEGWIDRLWRPVVGEIYYLGAVKFGKKNWRIRTREEGGLLMVAPKIVAQREGKYDGKGDVKDENYQK